MVLVGGLAMFLAVKTTASPAGLWAIVVVAGAGLAIWLYMVEIFATRRRPGRTGMADPPAGHAAPETATTRDDLPPVPGPRPDSDWVPAGGPDADRPEGSRSGTSARDGNAAKDGNAARDASGHDTDVPWTPPGPRQSPTDQPAPAQPWRGQRERGGGPQEPG
jgi:hypothetical protein